MPKGKKKDKNNRNRFDGSDQLSENDSYANDDESVASFYSGGCSQEDDESSSGEEDQAEIALNNLFEGLRRKSTEERINCYRVSCRLLVRKYMPGIIDENIFTITHNMEKSLNKGCPRELQAAAEFGAVICAQLGSDVASDEICHKLKKILLAVTMDTSVSSIYRAQYCTSLADIMFLSRTDIDEVIPTMQRLQTIFAGSFFKGDGTCPTITQDDAELHSSALSAWTLLLTLLPPGNIQSMLHNKTLPSLENLAELLESLHMDVRISAGEAFVVIFEMGRVNNEYFQSDFAEYLVGSLKEITNDSRKWQARNNRKYQRAKFRDILPYIRDGEFTEMKIKYDCKEVLILDTWAKKLYYRTLCKILGEAINHHLAENELVQEIMEIEPSANIVETEIDPAHRSVEKKIQKMVNAQNAKTRTKERARNRDKRADF